jgi:DNA-binding MarR family transcriptional regulator
MVDSVPKPPAGLAASLKHLARISEPESGGAGLTANQWTALRYFAQANRFSRTVSAFAAYNATTRGTASQTVKALETRGLLARTRRPEDGRSHRIDLTDAGRAKLAEDPAQHLVGALAALPLGLRRSLDRALDRLIAWVARARRETAFGTCRGCANLQEGCAFTAQAGVYRCRLIQARLEAGELDRLCAVYTPHRH